MPTRRSFSTTGRRRTWCSLISSAASRVDISGDARDDAAADDVAHRPVQLAVLGHRAHDDVAIGHHADGAAVLDHRHDAGVVVAHDARRVLDAVVGETVRGFGVITSRIFMGSCSSIRVDPIADSTSRGSKRHAPIAAAKGRPYNRDSDAPAPAHDRVARPRAALVVFCVVQDRVTAAGARQYVDRCSEALRGPWASGHGRRDHAAGGCGGRSGRRIAVGRAASWSPASSRPAVRANGRRRRERVADLRLEPSTRRRRSRRS